MNKKGFTLVELVVAIAALALCSGFILSMYFKSDELSDDADMYDEAMNQISFIAETFKGSTSPENFADNFHLETQEGEETQNWAIYYNENWYTEESADRAYITLYMRLEPEQKYDSGELYMLSLDFYKKGSEGMQEKVISLISKKYYPGGAR